MHCCGFVTNVAANTTPRKPLILRLCPRHIGLSNSSVTERPGRRMAGTRPPTSTMPVDAETAGRKEAVVVDPTMTALGSPVHARVTKATALLVVLVLPARAAGSRNQFFRRTAQRRQGLSGECRLRCSGGSC